MTQKPTDRLDVAIVELKRQMVVALTRIDPDCLVGFGHEIELSQFAAFLTEELTVRLSACVWAREACQIEAFPASWWQAWKQDHAPRWVVERWPVRMRRFEVTIQEIYPKLVIADADTRSTMRVAAVKDRGLWK